MRAIILDASPRRSGAGQQIPVCLLPLGDRPFLQHVVESLALRGIHRIDFAFADFPRVAAEYLGEGSRWGCEFHFHLISRAGIGPLIRSLTAGPDSGGSEGILIGQADRLPALPSDNADSWAAPGQPLFFVRASGDSLSDENWTGWGMFASRECLLNQMTAGADRLGSRHGWLRFESNLKQAPTARELSVESAECVLSSQQELLSGGFPGLVLGGREAEPGIWLGRNVSWDPTAKLKAPVYIGTNCRIGAGAEVGPFVVLAEDCIVGADSTIRHALICPNTYVGEGLDIDRSIVDRNHITDVKVGTCYRVTDNFLLGNLGDERHGYTARRAVDRMLAALLLLLLSPLMALRLLLNLHRSGTIERAEVLRIPEHSEQHAWKTYPLYKLRLPAALGRKQAGHFWSVFLPGLLSVVKGDLSLVGVQPRTAGEVARLPDDWRALYLQTKAGLITDAAVHFEPHPSEEDLHASECYYSATESFTQDLRLMASYLLKVSASPFESVPDTTPLPAEERTVSLPRQSSAESKGV